jgi:hypothetical protein
MNKKISKITTWLAAAVFLLALVINVKVTLDDPFSMINDKVFANETSIVVSSTPPPVYKWEQRVCKNLVSTYEICGSGDGNVCTNPGQRTRQCPYPGDL